MAKGGFRGGMPGGMNQAAMMKQAQKLQQQMLQMQQEQESKTFTAKAGGGMVSATVNGKHELINLEINPEAVDPDDVEMLQQQMLQMQQEQESKTFTAKAGGGMVSATVNGKHELINLEINPEAVDPDDVEMLQDMVMAAVNEAMRIADNEAANNMSRLTGGMNLGGLF